MFTSSANASYPLTAARSLVDQFQSQTPLVLLDPFLFCNPVDKNKEGILNPFDHLTCYNYIPPGTPVSGPIPIRNQFGDDMFSSLGSPAALCVPSTKDSVTPGS